MYQQGLFVSLQNLNLSLCDIISKEVWLDLELKNILHLVDNILCQRQYLFYKSIIGKKQKCG
ncbi:unnamed protein product [Paramecium octaurelia]|uniref:Uncharacterized protein n=1 Tax=Paramecium octaurelia TaxID=43137 RepID=A0A8S1VQJ7_PAROT|nr:unnamed protein product [Paramecium octaurelia]